VNNSTNDSTPLADRIINRAKDHPVIVVLLFLAFLATAFGAILDVPSKVYDAWHVLNPPDEPYEFSQKDLVRTSNPRFGFSFLHPRTWDRKDPTNSDGHTFVNPMDNDTEIAAWGQFDVVEGSSGMHDDTQKQLLGYRLIEDVEKGMWLVDTKVVNGERKPVRTEIPGRRLKYEYDRDGKK
jgi:hypothetical protein